MTTLMVRAGLTGLFCAAFAFGIDWLTDMLAQDYRLIVVDRPGCGYSERDGDAQAAPAEQARMIWALLDKLGVSQPVLVGHSLGGAVSLEMAVARTGAAGALALLAPATHPIDAPADAFKGLDIRLPLLRRIVAHTVAVPLAKKTADKVLTQIFAPEPYPDDFVIRGGGALGLRPRAFIATSGDFLAAGPGLEALSPRYAQHLRTPGGILFGAGDAVIPPEKQGRPMEEFGLRLETLPGRGHMLPITAPAECADFIRRMAALAR